VSGSEDHTVRLWDIIGGACLNTLKRHSHVVSVAFSPNGTRVVSGSEDQHVQLWDAISGACLNNFEGHTDTVRCVACSPDSTRIVSGSRTSTLQLWDTVTGANLITLQGYYLYSSISFSPDNTRLVFVSNLTLEMLDTVSSPARSDVLCNAF